MSIAKADEGIKICIGTAERLIKAGRLLYKATFLELATFLACAAIEEIGKALLLVEYQEDSFTGKSGAGKKLRTSFRDHTDKLEAALIVWKKDDLIFDQLKTRYQDQELTMPSLSELDRLIQAITIPPIKPPAQVTFRLRNRMLYTEFEGGKFHSPVKTANNDTFLKFIDIAEKALLRARFEWVLGKIVFRRGGSRRQIRQVMNENLPELLREIQFRTRERGSEHH